MTPSTTKCARPTCPNVGFSTRGGYCVKHAYIEGGSQKRIPAHHARTIIQKHLDAGHPISRIAEHTGVARNALRSILNGTSKTVRKSTLDKLATADPTPERVPAWRAARRIKSLRAAGHHVTELVAGIGLSNTSMNHIINGTWDTILATTFQRVDDYYRAHELDPARPATPKVIRKGWPLPLDWDDIDNPDDPADTRRDGPHLTWDTIQTIRGKVNATSISATAHELGVSASTISTVIRSRPGTYMHPRTLARMEAA